MKTFIFSMLACMSVLGMHSQSLVEWTESCPGHKVSFNLHDVVRNDLVADHVLNSGMMKIARTVSADNGVRWIDRIYNMPEELNVFYRQYGEKVEAVLNGQSNWLSDPEMGNYISSSNSYVVPMATYQETIDFTFPKGSTTDQVREAARAKASAVCGAQWLRINTFMTYLCCSLNYDFPEAFWVNSAYTWGNQYSYSVSYNPSAGTGIINYDHLIFMTLKDATFDVRRNEFRNNALVMGAVSEYNQLVSAILDGCPLGNSYKKVAYFNDWLTKNNCYNSLYNTSQERPTIIWSPLSALRGSTGDVGPVCEGYARAFKVLCDKSDIPCVLAVGYAKSTKNGTGEDHMWNEVQMDNNEWYAVDVTWNDPLDSENRKVSGKESDFWLLLGSEDMVAPGLTFAESHPNSITWSLNPDYVSQWDYSIASLITSHRFDAATGIDMAVASELTAPIRVFNLNGQCMGSFQSVGAMNRQQDRGRLLIVNGKKMFF